MSDRLQALTQCSGSSPPKPSFKSRWGWTIKATQRWVVFAPSYWKGGRISCPVKAEMEEKGSARLLTWKEKCEIALSEWIKSLFQTCFVHWIIELPASDFRKRARKMLFCTANPPQALWRPYLQPKNDINAQVWECCHYLQQQINSCWMLIGAIRLSVKSVIFHDQYHWGSFSQHIICNWTCQNVLPDLSFCTLDNK